MSSVTMDTIDVGGGGGVSAPPSSLSESFSNSVAEVNGSTDFLNIPRNINENGNSGGGSTEQSSTVDAQQEQAVIQQLKEQIVVGIVAVGMMLGISQTSQFSQEAAKNNEPN